MESKPRSQEHPDIIFIKETIRNAPQRIVREFTNTPNTWLACINTDIHVIYGYLQLAESDLDPELYKKLTGRIRLLGEKVLKLQNDEEIKKRVQQYKDDPSTPKQPEVSEELQNQLKKELDIFAEDYPDYDRV
jgi:hypothetical protein